MDPLTLGIAVFFALCWAGREVGKAVADGYRSGATAGRAKTQKLRGSDHIGDNMVGAALDGVGAVIGGTVRAGRAVGGAVGRGAQEGWQRGQAKGRQIRDNARAAGGQPRWRQLADWARDRAQGRPRGQERSWRERLRDWWNEGRDAAEATQTDRPDDRPDDPPSDGGPGDGGTPPPPPTAPSDPPPPPAPANPPSADAPRWEQPGALPLPETPPAPPVPDGPLRGLPGERRPAAECPHTNTTTDATTGTATCDDCGEIFGAGTTPGGDMPTATAAPSGEVQTFTQARDAAGQYHGHATVYTEKAASAMRLASDLRAELQNIHDSLQAASIGTATLGPAAGALEKSQVLVGHAMQLQANGDYAVAAANSVTEALDTHLGIVEAAAANADGGDRQFHGGRAEN